MTQHLDQLKLNLASVKAEIRLRVDNINRMKWEKEELVFREQALLREIELAKTAIVNPCLERVL